MVYFRFPSRYPLSMLFVLVYFVLLFCCHASCVLVNVTRAIQDIFSYPGIFKNCSGFCRKKNAFVEHDLTKIGICICRCSYDMSTFVTAELKCMKDKEIRNIRQSFLEFKLYENEQPGGPLEIVQFHPETTMMFLPPNLYNEICDLNDIEELSDEHLWQWDSVKDDLLLNYSIIEIDDDDIETRFVWLDKKYEGWMMLKLKWHVDPTIFAGRIMRINVTCDYSKNNRRTKTGVMVFKVNGSLTVQDDTIPTTTVVPVMSTTYYLTPTPASIESSIFVYSATPMVLSTTMTSSPLIPMTSSSLQPMMSSSFQTMSSSLETMMSSSLEAMTSSSLEAMTSSSLEAMTSSLEAMTSSSLEAMTSSSLEAMASSSLEAMTSSSLEAMTSSSLETMTSSSLETMTSSSPETMTSSSLDIMTSSSLETMRSSLPESVASSSSQGGMTSSSISLSRSSSFSILTESVIYSSTLSSVALSSSSMSTMAGPAKMSNFSHSGAVTGGVVGGIVVLLLIIVLLMSVFRKRRKTVIREKHTNLGHINPNYPSLTHLNIIPALNNPLSDGVHVYENPEVVHDGTTNRHSGVTCIDSAAYDSCIVVENPSANQKVKSVYDNVPEAPENTYKALDPTKREPSAKYQSLIKNSEYSTVADSVSGAPIQEPLYSEVDRLPSPFPARNGHRPRGPTPPPLTPRKSSTAVVTEPIYNELESSGNQAKGVELNPNRNSVPPALPPRQPRVPVVTEPIYNELENSGSHAQENANDVANELEESNDDKNGPIYSELEQDE